MRFVSLKWKVFTVTCILFLMLFLGRTVYTYIFLTNQLELQRQKVFIQNKNILNEVIKRNYSDLARLATEASSLQGMTEALSGIDQEKTGEIIEKNLDDYWWRMQLEMDVTTIGIFDNSNKPLAILGIKSLPLDLISETQKSEKPQFGMACYKNCFLYAAAPLLNNGKIVGTAVYGTSFSSIIVHFKSITDQDIAIIHHAPGENKEKNYLNRWKSQVLAISDYTIVLPVLLRMTNQFTVDRLLSKPIQFPSDKNHYEFSAIAISIDKNIHPTQAIIISNITESIQDIHSLFFRGLIYDSAGFTILILSLLAILWLPMSRLRRIAINMPLLATNDFKKFRKNIFTNADVTGIQDESDTLFRNITALSHKLEKMQSQIFERNAELELQSKELHKEKDFITNLLNTAHAVIITHDNKDRMIMVNDYSSEVTGYTQDELVGKNFSKLFPQEHLPEDYVKGHDMLLSGKHTELGHESNLARKDGKNLYMSWHHSSLPGENSASNQILTVALDINERKKAEEHLGWLASHDPLTLLYNRRYFNEQLDKTLAACIRYGRTAALMFLDLDKFKDVNDTSGHHIGDLLLRHVAEALKIQTRETDVVARLGGDEFAILLDQTNRDTAERIAQRICNTISTIVVKGENHTHHGSCSIGVVLLPSSNETSTDILADADIAMYSAKKSGRNNWVLYDVNLLSKKEARERVRWDEIVKSAIEKNLIELYFQPIMHIKNHHIDHYECLMRIHDNEKILAPVDFIRAAESSGLMAKVDEHIIGLAFKHKRNLELHNIHTTLAINLSGLSFQSSNLISHIQKCMEETRINPKEIIFEITETAAVSDVTSKNNIMAHLIKMDFSFALDDFGSGFSSLSYLKQFPIHYIKIDGSFIRNIINDQEDQALVKSIIDTARTFELKTIAEFVENRETLVLLESMDIDYAQGYHIDKPKPFSEVWSTVPDA